MRISSSPGDTAFVLVYLVMAGLAFRTFSLEWRRSTLRPYALLWAFMGLLLCLLAFQAGTRGLNNITQVFRQAAIQQHWYGIRRPLQKLLIMAVVVLTVPIGGLFLFLFRKVWRHYLGAGMALLFLLLYLAVQGISFHVIDYRMHAKYMGLQGKTWCQLFCLGVVALAMFWTESRERGRTALAATVEPQEITTVQTPALLSAPPEASGPAVGNCILLSITIFAAAHYRIVGIHWLYIGLPAALGNILLWLVCRRKAPAVVRPPSRPFLSSWLLLLPCLFFAIQSIAYLLALHRPVISQALVLLVYACSLWIVIQLTASTRQQRLLFRVLGSAGIAFCLEGLGQFCTRVRSPGNIVRALPFGNGLGDNDAGHLIRLTLPCGYWNATAQILLVFTAICLGLSAASLGREKRAWQAAAALHFVCALLTASRWGFACLLLTLPLFFVRHNRILRAGALGVLGLLGVWLVRWTLRNFQSLFQISGSLRFRFRRWAWCLDAARHNPLLGGGAAMWADFARRAIGVDGLYYWTLGVGGWLTLAMLFLLIIFHAWSVIRLLRSDISLAGRELVFGITLGIGGLLLGGILETLLPEPAFVLLFLVFSGLIIGSQPRSGPWPIRSDADDRVDLEHTGHTAASS